MNKKVNVGFCVAYDWEYLKISLPLIYDFADRICLALDKDRISWSGRAYQLNFPEFQKAIRKIDVDNKILIYEDSFYVEGLSSMENESRERFLLNKFFEERAWMVQLDVDEYFLNFRDFSSILKNFLPNNDVNIWCPTINLIKKLEDGYVYGVYEKFGDFSGASVASNGCRYLYGRVNDYRNIKLPFYIINQTQARSEEELRTKLMSYGHSDEPNILETIDRWRELDRQNYKSIMIDSAWNGIFGNQLLKLEFAASENIEDLIKIFRDKQLPSIPIERILLRESAIDIWRSIKRLLKNQRKDAYTLHEWRIVV